jgi:uncharacterized protein (TIGR02246 family)
MVAMDRDEAVALFEKRRDAWLREDLDAYLALFADDLVLQTPMGEPLRGLAAYAELVRRSYEHVRPVAFEFHEIAVHGSRVLAEWTITIGVRATGRQIPYRGMSICEVEDGRIRSWREYYDPADLRPA